MGLEKTWLPGPLLLPCCGTLDWSHPGLGLSFPTGPIRGVGKGPYVSSQVKTKLSTNPFWSFEEPRAHTRPGTASVSQNHSESRAPSPSIRGPGGDQWGLGEPEPQPLPGEWGGVHSPQGCDLGTNKQLSGPCNSF